MLAAPTVSRERMAGWSTPTGVAGPIAHLMLVVFHYGGLAFCGLVLRVRRSTVPICNAYTVSGPHPMEGPVGPDACKIDEASQPGRKASVTSLAPARALL